MAYNHKSYCLFSCETKFITKYDCCRRRRCFFRPLRFFLMLCITSASSVLDTTKFSIHSECHWFLLKNYVTFVLLEQFSFFFFVWFMVTNNMLYNLLCFWSLSDSNCDGYGYDIIVFVLLIIMYVGKYVKWREKTFTGIAI